MKTISLVLKHSLAWHRREFLITYSLMPIFLFAALFFKKDSDLSDYVIQLLCLAIGYSAIFTFKATVMSFSRQPAFSFKYLSSLPIDRRDLVLACIIQSIAVGLPTILYSSLLAAHLNKDIHPFVCFIATICVVCFVIIVQFQSYFRIPRLEYFLKQSKLVATRQLFRFILGSTASFVTTLFIIFRWDIQIDAPILGKFFKIFAYSVAEFLEMFTEWPFFFIAVGGSYLLFQRTIREWADETLSYPKKVSIGKPHFEFVCVAFILGIATYSHFSPPFRYIDDSFLVAVYERDVPTIHKMVNAGEDLNRPRKDGVRPVHVAAAEGHLEVLMYLEARGAKLDVVADELNYETKVSVLKAALLSAREDVAMYLLKNGYDFKADMQKYRTNPLHKAASFCHIDTMDFLLNNGIDVNFVDKLGETALHRAARNGCYEATLTLMNRGIDTNQKNNQGKMALNLAPGKDFKKFMIRQQHRMPASSKN